MEQRQPTFLVTVDPIKKELREAARKIRRIGEEDPAQKKEAEREIRILKKCNDELGNLEWI